MPSDPSLIPAYLAGLLAANTEGQVGANTPFQGYAQPSEDVLLTDEVLAGLVSQWSSLYGGRKYGSFLYGWPVSGATLTSQASGSGAAGFVVTDDAATYGSFGIATCSRATAPAVLLGDGTQFWIAARLKYGWNAAGQVGNFPWLFDWRTDGNNRLGFAYVPSATPGASVWDIVQQSGGSQTGSAVKARDATSGTSDLVVAQYTATQLMVSVTGSVFVSGSRGGVVKPSGTTFDLGSFAGGVSNWIDSSLLWVACGQGLLGNTDPAAMFAFGDSAPTISQMPARWLPTGIWPCATAAWAY